MDGWNTIPDTDVFSFTVKNTENKTEREKYFARKKKILQYNVILLPRGLLVSIEFVVAVFLSISLWSKCK